MRAIAVALALSACGANSVQKDDNGYTNCATTCQAALKAVGPPCPSMTAQDPAGMSWAAVYNCAYAATACKSACAGFDNGTAALTGTDCETCIRPSCGPQLDACNAN